MSTGVVWTRSAFVSGGAVDLTWALFGGRGGIGPVEHGQPSLSAAHTSADIAKRAERAAVAVSVRGRTSSGKRRSINTLASEVARHQQVTKTADFRFNSRRLAYAPYFRKHRDQPVVKVFVDGVSAAATGAIAGAAYVLATRAVVDAPTALIALVSFAVLARWKISELWVIATAGAIGMAIDF